MLSIVSFMRFRSKRCASRIARALLLFMLFTQAALAYGACLAPSNQLAETLSQAQQSDCDDLAMNANLCVAHCTADSQTLDHHSCNVPVVVSAVGAFVVVPVFQRPEIAAAPSSLLPAATAPPIPILYCSFLI
jgi:hypothetical protein